MNITTVLKSKITWLVITIIILIIILVIVSKPDVKPVSIECKEDVEERHVCKDKMVCGPKCDEDRIYDCDTKKCECKGNMISCLGDSVCCEACENDVCCSSDTQIAVGGKVSCCAPGTLPDSNTKTQCLTTCGIKGGPCQVNQTCNKLSGLSKSTYDTMLQQHTSDKSWRGGKWDDVKITGDLFFCTDPPKCMWSEPQALPHSVGDAYLNYEINLGGSGFNSLCIPKNGDTSCYSKTQNACDPKNCDWVNLLDNYSKDSNNTEKLLNEFNNSRGKSVLGYYCGDNSKSWGRLEKVVKDPGSSICTWQDCYNRISNSGTIDVKWDEKSNSCSALKTGNTTGGIQSLIECTNKGEPCSSCTEKGQFVNCIKCNNKDNPCKECENNGQYVPVDSCTTTGWRFQACKKENKNVLKYDASQDENNGNCPWGCNDPTSQECMNTTTDKPYIFGQELPGTTEVCYNDGQIKNNLPNFWRAYAPPSGKSCSIKDDSFCNNPGKSICTYSKQPCNEGEVNCYPSKTQCETRNSCEPGWLRNSDDTDCNVFMCSKYGSLVNRNIPAGQIANNGLDYFEYVNNACQRRGAQVDPDKRDYCRVNGFTCAGGGAPEAKLGKGWKGHCNYKLFECTGTATDELLRVPGDPLGPKYKYCYKYLGNSDMSKGPFLTTEESASTGRTAKCVVNDSGYY